MVKLSDHISWQPIRTPAITDDTFYIFALSIPFIICFSILNIFLLFYVVLAEKNYAVGRHAFNKGISWSGAAFVAFAAASLAALDVALFVACHHANHLKAIFRVKILYLIILPAINRAIEIHKTAYDHIVESPNAAKSYLRELLKDKKRLQRASDLFCATLVATFVMLSLYLQLSVSGLLSQDDLRHIFGTYFISISTLSCLLYAFCLHHTTLIPGYVLDYLHQTAGTYWKRFVTMVDLDEPLLSIPQTSDNDTLLHPGEEMPDPEELLTLHLQSQCEFGFDNQNDLVTLFGDLRDHLSLELPSVAIMSSNQFAISKTDGSVKYCRKSFGVMKEQSVIGFFHFAYSSLRD
ncbi:hypothetical protein KCU77_g3197, partial [Aureobasidium melanogenum]